MDGPASIQHLRAAPGKVHYFCVFIMLKFDIESTNEHMAPRFITFQNQGGICGRMFAVGIRGAGLKVGL